MDATMRDAEIDMIEASVQRAETDLADRSHFALSTERMQAFMCALDAPLSNPTALRALFERPAPWDKA